MFKYVFVSSARDWAGGCVGGNLILPLCFLGATAQALALNDATWARWQHLYPDYSGFIVVQWEEAKIHYPSLCQWYEPELCT